MSPTATLERTEVRTPVTLQDPAETTDDQVLRELTIEAFMRKTGAECDLVTSFVDSIVGEITNRSGLLNPPGRTRNWHPDTTWLKAYHDLIFVKAMPDDTPAEPGSAHARLQDLCGVALGHSVVLTHVRVKTFGLNHCALCIRVRAR